MSVQTCPYREESSGFVTDVTFRGGAIPVRGCELRTGELIASRKAQVSGVRCLASLT
ncbi:hypothetical protein OK074_7773 [Actinobacteria bacterium OK074]|nr:hypothetical protein OK074_7773 [Actinobacteria bacterium OK074]